MRSILNRILFAGIVGVFLLAAGCASASSAASASAPRPTTWASALAPTGTPGPALVLSRDGVAGCVVNIPEKATPQEKRAAKDLARWLKEMGGAEFRIVADPEPRLEGLRVISLGATQRRQAAMLFAAPDLGDEGYQIVAKDGDLFLAGGRTRGIVNAVYALLEEDLGCRWYTRDAAVIPHSADVILKPVSRSFMPKLALRDPYYWDTFDAEWSIHNRTNSSAASVPADAGGNMRSASGMFVHTFNRLVPPDKYFKDHPEYFSMLKGERTRRQLCMSNADVVRISIEEVKKALAADPTATIVSVSQNDDHGFCECPDCKKVFDEEGSHSGALLRYVNAVANAVAKEHPHVLVSTLAYMDTFQPPKVTRPAANVVFQLCTDSHSWGQPFQTVHETKKFQEAMKGWEAIGAKTLIWDYTVNFSHYAAVMPNLPIVSDDIRFFVDHGASGVMLQGSYQGPGGGDAALKSWVWAKQLWDPSLDTKVLMRDYVFGYYGAAAGAMWEWQMLQWRLWEKEHGKGLKSPPDGIRFSPALPAFSQAFYDQAGALFDKAQAAAGDTETRRRVELAKFSWAYSVIARHVDRMLAGEEKPDEMWDALMAWMETVAAREHIQYLAEGPPNFASWAARLKKISTLKGTEQQTWAGKSPKGEVKVAKLSTVWRVAPDPKKVGVKQQWFSPNHDDKAWRTVRSDLDWGWEHQGMPGYLGEAWYRQSATLSEDFRAKHVYLYFEACDEDAWVYVDGKLALDHSCEKTGMTPEQIWNAPFMVDVAPGVPSGAVLGVAVPTTIAVRVNNRAGMGGVWKPAWVVASDAELTLAEVKAATAR
ncbi:MAG: DUF4838 domain-containing protein [Planctomycetota bacterium]|nr:DUF4838 domain-containing protein [Planctomycetota bacterium]